MRRFWCKPNVQFWLNLEALIVFIKITVIYINDIVPTDNPFCSRPKNNLIEEIIFLVT